MDKTTYLSWPDIEKSCYILSEQIQQKNLVVDTIVAVQRGGCIPGVLLSHIMGITDFYTIGVRTTVTDQIHSVRFEEPIISVDYSLNNIKGKKILIVDDVVNTGNTINETKKQLWEFQPISIKTLALVWDGSNNNQTCPADFYALYTPDWVVFPWER